MADEELEVGLKIDGSASVLSPRTGSKVGRDVTTNLLVDITIAGAPAEDTVVAARAVDGGLRVDGEEAELVHARELLRDGRRLRAELLL